MTSDGELKIRLRTQGYAVLRAVQLLNELRRAQPALAPRIDTIISVLEFGDPVYDPPGVWEEAATS